MAAQREARANGFDDALLTSGASTILEGPTFCVAWVFDGVLETPALDLGILDSITRRRVIGLAPSIGVRTAEGRYQLDRIRDASEVMVVSTMREVQAVSVVDETSYGDGPITKALKEAFGQLVLSEGL
jgi:branched-chain amino acid aminotransferase